VRPVRDGGAGIGSNITGMNDRFHRFREFHREFNYTGVSLQPEADHLRIEFAFDIDDRIHFRPSLRIPAPAGGWKIDPAGPLAARMAFCIGMVEVASYWKTYCPPRLNILAGALSGAESAWWRNLYYHGLGEFFYRNGIETTPVDFVSIHAPDSSPPAAGRIGGGGRKLIPVGGGKDSIVTLELLREERENSDVLLVKAPRAARECAEIAGFPPGQIIEVARVLDPQLLALNAEGALNGHTPFSALLAFVSLLTAALSGDSSIVLSNESSANEPTVHGSEVNHQYSKSFAFEQDFRRYVREYLTPDIDYFSLLRPINELQIAALLAEHPVYFPVFRSCNAGSREGVWCGHCGKCMFTYLMLQPFCSSEVLEEIFGRNLLDDPALEGTLLELMGCSAAKPFDCVGTVEEVRAALSLALTHPARGHARGRLLEVVRTQHAGMMVSRDAALALPREWNGNHNLPPEYERRLRATALFRTGS